MLKDFAVIVLIFLALSLVVGVLFYNGFFFHTPSSATFLTEYNDLEHTKTWDTFKTSYPQIDPTTIENPFVTTNDISVTVSEPSLLESATIPKYCITFNVAVTTNFEKNNYGNVYSTGSLTQPSILIFLLDQNDRIRGKLYSIQSSADFYMNGNNRTDYTFWFEIPEDMQNQPITVIAELFGVRTTNQNYNSYGGSNYDRINHQAYNDVYDDVYGSVPDKTPQSAISGYQYPSFLVSNRVSMHTPVTFSIWELAGYSESLAVIFTAIFAFMYLVRNKTQEWRSRNKFQLVTALMFIVTYFFMLIIVGIMK